MEHAATLYAQLKPDIEAVAGALLDASEFFIKNSGNFLPHGAVLTSEGEVKMVGAAPDAEVDYTNATEVLPVLHEALRAFAVEDSIIAIGVAENVSITLEGQKSTDAIKVLVEHEQGLVTALYLPFNKAFLRGYTFGEIFSVVAEPEVNAWP